MLSFRFKTILGVSRTQQLIRTQSGSTKRSILDPEQVVEILDKHIIGQSSAKKAVAIALRNRYRRRQLDVELQKEVMPANILMKGTSILFPRMPYFRDTWHVTIQGQLDVERQRLLAELPPLLMHHS